MTKHAQHGVSLVELMVGMTIGLMIVATASLLMSHQMKDTRRLGLETQVEQDLRAAADLIARDLRRAGYWQHASQEAVAPGSAPNPYADVTASNTARSGSTLAYAKPMFDPEEDDGRLDANDRSGIKLESGVLRLLFGDSGWQAITDPEVVTITRFQVTMDKHQVPLELYCAKPCSSSPPSGSVCPPMQEIREAHIELAGVAARDPGVQRALETTVRLRNDRVVGSCGV